MFSIICISLSWSEYSESDDDSDRLLSLAVDAEIIFDIIVDFLASKCLPRIFSANGSTSSI